MTKPIVFFSHSSLDKQVLQRLKEQFVKKTGGSIEVFLSSDGESIPLGRNWVYKVQEALEQARLQVVFLTENAFKSGWTYFEGGFSYSKGIRVVPVGFRGVDLSQVHPPLGFLQGFNITNEDGLNNLIALVNKEFGYSHELSFTKEEYEQLFQGQEHGRPTALGDYSNTVEKIFFRFPKPIDPARVSTILRDISTTWSANLIESVFAGQSEEPYALHAHGISLVSAEDEHLKLWLLAEIEPLALEYALKIIGYVLPSMKGVTIKFQMESFVGARRDYSSATARLIGFKDISLLENKRLGFKSLEFGLEHNMGLSRTVMTPATCLDITLNTDVFPLDEFSALLTVLFQREILHLRQRVEVFE